MNDIINLGRDISLVGKGGANYHGRIFEKDSESTITGKAIVCLTDSRFVNGAWQHHMNAVFITDRAEVAFKEFKNRDDIPQLILIPLSSHDLSQTSKTDDLIQNYIHGN